MDPDQPEKDISEETKEEETPKKKLMRVHAGL